MLMTVYPGIPRGEAALPRSKAWVHRVMLASFLSGSGAPVCPECDDTRAMRDCLQVLRCTPAGGVPVINAAECGTVLRFLLPVCAALYEKSVIRMGDTLAARPTGALTRALSEHGTAVSREGDRLVLTGRLRPGGKPFRLPGDISSQYFSGLLFALPLIREGGEIIPDTVPESSRYISLTGQVLRLFGVRFEQREDGTFSVPGGQAFAPACPELPCDLSLAAFLLCMNRAGGSVRINGYRKDPYQADSMMEELLCSIGGRIDVRECPDLFLPLCVSAALETGAETVFTGVKRLRYKECDRLRAAREMLEALKIRCTEEEDRFTVLGGRPAGGRVNGFRDHRVVMAAAVLGMFAGAPVTVTDAECTDKSWPGFWKTLNALGICTEQRETDE